MERVGKIFKSKPGAAPWEARIAMLVVAFLAMFMLFNATTGCASAASCEVGSTEGFAGNISFDSGTSFTYTLDHGITADRTLVFPDAAVAKGSVLGGTAANTLGLLAVGSNGQVLAAASGEATGLEWVDLTDDVGAQIATGEYTGDGTTSYTPPNACGFQPKYVSITPRRTTSGVITYRYWTTTEMVDNHVDGLAVSSADTETSLSNTIIGLTATSFTVDDNGANEPPNTAGTVYEYVCHG